MLRPIHSSVYHELRKKNNFTNFSTNSLGKAWGVLLTILTCEVQLTKNKRTIVYSSRPRLCREISFTLLAQQFLAAVKFQQRKAFRTPATIYKRRLYSCVSRQTDFTVNVLIPLFSACESISYRPMYSKATYLQDILASSVWRVTAQCAMYKHD